MLNESTRNQTIEVPTFGQSYLPLLAEEYLANLIDHVLDTMIAQKQWSVEEGWSATQKISGVGEDDTYAGLAVIADAIHDACVSWDKDVHQLGPRTTTWLCEPRLTTYSEVSGDSMITDTRSLRVSSSTPKDHRPNTAPTVRSSTLDAPFVGDCPQRFNTDVTTVGEVKLSEEDRAENEAKLSNAASHILYSDPCRRFINGMSIEDSTMRLWHFCRSHIAVSKPFDYHKEPKEFARFVIFSTFASYVAQGYDEDVIRVRDEDIKIQYQFEVGGNTYQTLGSLDESRALDIVTRATRVWVVKKVAEEGELVGDELVLKDVWLYSDAKSELEIQNEIFSSLRELNSTMPADEKPNGVASLEDDARRYFLTIFHDEAVKVGDDLDEAVLPDNGNSFCYAAELAAASAAGAAILEAMRGTLPVGNPQPIFVPFRYQRARTDHKPRMHRRVVFKERCKTFYEVTKYVDLTEGLAQLVEGLYYMRLAGYVHRDISPGNCLFHDDQVKISDLEHARRYEDISLNRSPLTGTPAFMAVEYQRRAHKFLPKSARYNYFRAEVPEPQWFRFNFVHDLESVAWIYAWHLFHTIPDGLCTPSTRDARLAIRDMALDLFHGSVEGSTLRTRFIERATETDGVFQHALDTLMSAYTSKVGKYLVKGLGAFQRIVNCYLTIEASTPLDAGNSTLTRWDPALFTDDFHGALRDWFRKIHGALTRHTEGATLVSVPLVERPSISDPEPRLSAKRKRDDSDELELALAKQIRDQC